MGEKLLVEGREKLRQRFVDVVLPEKLILLHEPFLLFGGTRRRLKISKVRNPFSVTKDSTIPALKECE